MIYSSNNTGAYSIQAINRRSTLSKGAVHEVWHARRTRVMKVWHTVKGGQLGGSNFCDAHTSETCFLIFSLSLSILFIPSFKLASDPNFFTLEEKKFIHTHYWSLNFFASIFGCMLYYPL